MLCNTLYQAPRPQSVDMANKDIGIKIRENLYCVIHCTGRQAMMAVAMHCSGPAPWWAVSFELLGYANYRRGPLKRCQFSGYNFIKTRLNLSYWNSVDLVYFFLLGKISIRNWHLSHDNCILVRGNMFNFLIGIGLKFELQQKKWRFKAKLQRV